MAEPILRLAFTCREWLRSNAIGVRIKIENGIFYVKPTESDSASADLVRFTILEPPHPSSYQAVLNGSHALTRRIISLLIDLGWDGQRRAFRLLPAQRGWYSIMAIRQTSQTGKGGYMTAYLAAVSYGVLTNPKRTAPKYAV